MNWVPKKTNGNIGKHMNMPKILPFDASSCTEEQLM